MMGPSAIGSENGKPSSMASAPAASSARSSSTVRSLSGCPAVMYGTSARLPAVFSSAKRRAIASDEIVTDPDTIAIRIFCLDDCTKECARLIAVREIDEGSRVDDVAVCVAHDTNDGTRQHLLQRIHRVHDAQ